MRNGTFRWRALQDISSYKLHMNQRSTDTIDDFNRTVDECKTNNLCTEINVRQHLLRLQQGAAVAFPERLP